MMHIRRYYTVLAAAADLEGNAAASVALGMRGQEAGTPLASTFPHRAAVIAAGYPCAEDLPDLASDPDPPGARAALREELLRHGLAASAADDVIASL